MAARKYWKAQGWFLYSGNVLEFSEFQLYNAGARVDATATLTSSYPPDSGTLASIKDNNTGTGAYWTGAGSYDPVLSWEFPSALAVDSVVVGSRTTAARFPMAFVLQGGDTVGAWDVTLAFGGLGFVSAAKIGPLTPGSVKLVSPASLRNTYAGLGGNGRVRGTVKEKHTPANLPVFRRVRLIRERDGLVIREQWSDPATGAYDFQWVDEAQTYTVMSYDHTHNMQAVANDNLTPELMP